MEVDEESLIRQLINSSTQKNSQTSNLNKDNYSFHNNPNSTIDPASEKQNLSNFTTFDWKVENSQTQ